MKYLIIIFLTGLIASCAWLGTPNDSQIPTISAPPQNLSESDASMPILPPNNASGTAKNQISNNEDNTQPRIQEERSNGVVEQIKVNNGSLPSYYIYPTQQQNYDVNQIPDRNIVTPNWQISW